MTETPKNLTNVFRDKCIARGNFIMLLRSKVTPESALGKLITAFLEKEKL